MSTEIKSIPATNINDRFDEIQITRFFGGKDIGKALQLTQRANEDLWTCGYITLTKDQARTLAKRLIDFVSDNDKTLY